MRKAALFGEIPFLKGKNALTRKIISSQWEEGGIKLLPSFPEGGGGRGEVIRLP